MEKSNKINNLRNNDKKRNNTKLHYTDEMKEYILDLWFEGTSEHVIERLIDKKIRQMRWRFKQENNVQKSA